MNLGSIKDKTNKKQTVRKICAAAAVGCVAIVAVATAIKLGGNNNNVAPVIEKPKTTQSTESGNDVSLTTPAPRTTPAPAPTDKVAGAETKVTSAMLLPVAKCNVLKGYASDMLVYSGTLKHWSTHTGIDLAADAGSEVLCALDGEVKKIEKDELMGNRITVEHSDGYETVYASLDSVKEGLSEGSKVLRGQSLGTVGTSAAGEVEDGAHLHFEVYLDGKSVNPQTYLGDLAK